MKQSQPIILPDLPRGIPPFFPGPMEGVMKPEIIAAFNELELISVWMTPFIRITMNVQKQKHLQRFIAPFIAGKVPVIVQLMATDAQLAGETASMLTGFPEVRGINLNFACPSRQVVRHGAGGGQLRNPAEMFEIASEIRAAIPDLSLSVKLRCGFEDASEILSWTNGFKACGVEFAVVHCRTVKENYTALTASERIKRLSAVIIAADGLPIVANGDIYSPADGAEYLNAADFAGLMAGRGLFHDPYLLQRLSGNDAPASEDGARIFFNKYLEISRRDGKMLYRSSLLETARMIWGGRSPLFKTVLNWNDEEMKCAQIT